MRLTVEMKKLLVCACAMPLLAQTVLAPGVVEGRALLAKKDFASAKALFAAYEKLHPQDALGAMGEGDADVGLHELEDAEIAYRRAVMLQPELWVAHKDLVLLEARLGRWEEFDRERALLRGARERGAPNISKQESDPIDAFTAAGRQWTVREYFEPMGRSEARYNFETFDGGAEYVSLEPKDAAQAALSRDAQVAIGAAPKQFGDVSVWALNWYSAKGHGTVKVYAKGEPTYETVRADVMRWLRAQGTR